MIFTALTPALSVASQLTEADVAQAARDGFRAIVNNRPDCEDTAQLPSVKIAHLAAQYGMEQVFVPAVSGKIGADEITRMARALARLKAPVLAFCRTGTRSTTLWALTQASSLPATEIIATAAAAGFDLTALRLQLEALAAARSALDSQPRVILEPIQYVLGLLSGGLVGFTLGLVGGGGSILAVPLMVYLNI